MLRNGLWNHIIMLSILTMLIFVGNPSLAAQETTSEGSTTPTFGAPKVSHDLSKAAEKGSIQNVTQLIADGADVNYYYGLSLRQAARYGHVEVVKYLLEAGANPDATIRGPPENEIYFGLPLTLAAKYNHLEVVNILLEAGASIETQNEGLAALDRAANHGYLRVVQRLLEAGVDIHYRDDLALNLAALKGHLDVVKQLIRSGATITGQALNYASKNGHLEVVKTLIKGGVSTDYLDNAFSEAESSGQLEVVKFLLENGAGHNNDEDSTPPGQHLSGINSSRQQPPFSATNNTETSRTWPNKSNHPAPLISILIIGGIFSSVQWCCCNI